MSIDGLKVETFPLLDWLVMLDDAGVRVEV